jgi:SAM-dependent methyltransferase
MNLLDIIHRNMDLQPWAEGERIPWDDPDFSQRILREHLTQDHDAASRRKVKIKKHVDWIHRQVLGGKPTHILDLGCGPGLYAAPFTKLGHTYTGIDFSPACIDYARENSPKNAAYQLGDIRSAEYGIGYGLVLYIFGALNIVREEDARSILKKAYAALDPGGIILLEVSSLDSVDQIGNQPSMWYSAESGLFSDKPHLCLMENFWDEEQATATERFYIVDAATGQVTRHAASTQGYDEEQIESLLRDAGFGEVAFVPSLTGKAESEGNEFLVVTAIRPVK